VKFDRNQTRKYVSAFEVFWCRSSWCKLQNGNVLIYGDVILEAEKDLAMDLLFGLIFNENMNW